MMRPFCPILVNFGTYTDADGLLVIRLSDRMVRLRLADAQGQALWQLIGRLCDGQTELADVLDRYKQSPITGIDPDAFHALLNDLLTSGVLQDAARVFSSFISLARPDSLWGRVLPESDWPTRQALTHQDAEVNWLIDSPGTSSTRSWHDLIKGRRSTYRFKDQCLTSSELSELLKCYSATDKSLGTARRAVPSGGGLYQLRLWLLLLKPCDAFGAGVYEVVYSANGGVGLSTNDLVEPADLWREALLASTDPRAMQHASAWLVVGANLHAIAKKYRNLAYSHAQIEAGAVLQNLGLIASAMDVGMHVRAGFDHRRLRDLCCANETTLLISAVIGAKASATEVCSQKILLEMGWNTRATELPFHVATARVFVGDNASMDCFGRSHDAALAYDKALSEALERYAMMHGPEPITACWGELPNMVHPHAVLRWPNADFDESQSTNWIAFKNLQNAQTHYLLHDFCFYRPNPQATYASLNTSGMACAPSRDMALTLATLELVERDAFMRAWLTGAACQPISLEILDEATRSLVLRFRAQGCRVVLGLLPSEWAVVVMVFVQHETHGFTRISAAADFDATSAASKAMSELATGVVVSLHGAVPESICAHDVRSPEDHGRLYCQREHFKMADFLVAPGDATQKNLPTTMSQDIWSRMWRAGLSIYACEAKLPGKHDYMLGGNPVVYRVVIPGLIPMVFGNAQFPLPEKVVPAWHLHERVINSSLVHPFP